MKAMVVAALGVLLLAGCGLPAQRSSSAAEPASSSPSPTSRDVDGCPVTIPPQPGFVPPEPYPSSPPELYRAVWFGTDELWTMLAPEGEVWEDLPELEGNFTQKSIWWSASHSLDDPATLVLSGRRLDRPGTVELGRTQGGGFRRDIGNFLMVGLSIPAGCWELTATYRGAELSYVVLIKG